MRCVYYGLPQVWFDIWYNIVDHVRTPWRTMFGKCMYYISCVFMCLVFPKKKVFAMEPPTRGTTQSAMCVNTYRHIIRCMHFMCAGRVEHCHCFAILLFGYAQHTHKHVHTMMIFSNGIRCIQMICLMCSLCASIYSISLFDV